MTIKWFSFQRDCLERMCRCLDKVNPMPVLLRPPKSNDFGFSQTPVIPNPLLRETDGIRIVDPELAGRYWALMGEIVRKGQAMKVPDKDVDITMAGEGSALHVTAQPSGHGFDSMPPVIPNPLLRETDGIRIVDPELAGRYWALMGEIVRKGQAMKVSEMKSAGDVPDVVDTMKITMPKSSGWTCDVFGMGEGFVIEPAKHQLPNRFWRWMQFIFFGNRWMKKGK